MLNQKTMMSFSEERGSLRKDPRCGSLCLDLYEPHKEKEELGFEYGALLGRVFKCLSKLVGSAFYLPPMLLARCPSGSQRIVVRGRKLVPRANAKRFS